MACPMNSEKASVAKVGDVVTLRLPTADEIEATIQYIVEEEEDKRVVVFRITDDVEKMLEYREIQIDIVWWSYRGLKVSNSTILEENDISYVERTKAGYTEKIYVKILRQNDTYSIVENYMDEELEKLGFNSEYIKNRYKLKVYDEIILH